MPAESAHERSRLVIRRAAGLPSLELHEGTAYTHSYPRHWHDELFVTVITGGAGVFRYGRTESCATAGTLVVIAPREVHAHSPRPGGRSFQSLHATSPFVSELVPELPRLAGPGGLRSGATSDVRLVRRFLALHRLLKDGRDRLVSESRLLDFLVDLAGRLPSGAGLDASPASAPERASIRRARQFLDDAGASRVSLSELAALAGMSPFHFHRLFRTQVGMPPHEYQLRGRLQRARALLGEGESAADVAAATGFADQSHLTRHFKRLVGFPPADYSRRVHARRSKNVQDTVP